MDDKIYVTLTGAQRIAKSKEDLLAKLRQTQSQKGEAAEVGGNQWHDNFAFEQLQREEDLLNGQIRAVNELLDKMVVVSLPPKSNSNLTIGHVAVLDIEGEEVTYLIGGYEDTDLSSSPPVISYLAPVIRPFIGKQTGHNAKVMIQGKSKLVKLEEIKPV